MLIGTIRPLETITVDVAGHSLAEVQANAIKQAPAGFELTSAPVRMVKGSTALTATATFTRVDGVRAIEAPDRRSLFEQVPPGWRMLSVRSL